MGTRTRRKVQTLEQGHFSFLSIVEPGNFQEAINDEHWKGSGGRVKLDREE